MQRYGLVKSFGFCFEFEMQISIPKRSDLPARKLVAIQALCDQGLTDAEIGEQCCLAPELVAECVKRENWRSGEPPTAEAEQLADLRWGRALAAQARWLALRGADAAGQALDDGNVRSFKDAAQGTVAMAQIARANKTEKGSIAEVNIGLFFLSLPETSSNNLQKSLQKDGAIEV